MELPLAQGAKKKKRLAVSKKLRPIGLSLSLLFVCLTLTTLTFVLVGFVSTRGFLFFSFYVFFIFSSRITVGNF